MKYLDLFSGIAGFRLGLEQAGFEFEWEGFSDINKNANKVYRKQFPNAKELGDVRTIDAEGLPRGKWIITGGWPCQGNSMAGKRKGQSGDPRSSLFNEIVRILVSFVKMGDEFVFIGENVPGLYSVNSGVDFLTTIKRLSHLDTDSPQLTVEMQLLNTVWFLPQSRERLYFTGYPRTKSRPQVFPIGEGEGFLDKEGSEKQGRKEGVSSTIDSRYGALRNSGETYLKVEVADFRTDEGIRIRKDGVSPTLNTCNNSETYPSRMCPLVIIQESDIRLTGKLKARDICPTLKSETHGGDTKPLIVEPYVQTVPHGWNDGITKPYPNLRAESNSQHNELLVQNANIRRFTPVECLRLQGFSDSWLDGLGLKDTVKYQLIGNAVSVPVVKAIAERLIKSYAEVKGPVEENTPVS